MTEELRQRANTLHSEIQDLEGRIQTLKDINSSNRKIRISNDEVGVVYIEAGDYEPALDFIIDILKQKKEAKEDEYRML